MNDIMIRLVALDPRVKGFVKEDPDGNYNVYINSCLCVEAQRATCEHELEHINLNHLRSDRPVRELEEEADKERRRRIEYQRYRCKF